MPSVNPLDWFAPPGGPKPAELPPLANAQSVRVLWSTSVGSADVYFFSPVLADDSIFTAARDGTVARLDAATGQVRWRTSAGTKLSAGVGADASVVVLSDPTLALTAAEQAKVEQVSSPRKR